MEELAGKIRELINKGNNKDALKLIDQIILKEAKNEYIWILRGRALSNVEKYNEAIKSYDEAIKIEPKSYWARINKGKALRELKRFDEALRSIDEAIKISPEQEPGWVDKGDILNKLEKYDEALKSFDEAIRVEPKSYWARINKGEALQELNRFDEALRSIDEAIKISPEQEPGWIEKGEILTKLEKYDEALKSFDEAIRVEPKEEIGWLARGKLLEKLGKNKEALASVDEAIRIKPSELTAWIMRAGLLRTDKKYKKAIDSINKAIECNPEEGIGWFLKGNILSLQNKLPDALSALEKARKLFSKAGKPNEEIITLRWVKSIEKSLKEQQQQITPPIEVKIIRNVRQSIQKDPNENPQKSLYERNEKNKHYFGKPRSITEDDSFFLVLRRWNSFTPRIPNTLTTSLGGGYFLVWKGRGIVIDPGFDFMDNFDKAGFSLQDIDAVVVTHAHTDHTADLETILCLKHEEHKIMGDSHKVDLFMNLGSLHKFIGWISQLGVVDKIISLNVGDSIYPEEYPFVLQPKDAKHQEVIGSDAVGLVFDLLQDRESVLKLGITSDTGWTTRIQSQYKGCQLLCIHLGSIGENEFDESLPLRGKKRLYAEHLGLIGSISIAKAIKPKVCVVSEFGEELESERTSIAKSMDRFLTKTKCITGDIGLKIRLPDINIYCNICGKCLAPSNIVENMKRGEVIYNCRKHTQQELLDWLA